MEIVKDQSTAAIDDLHKAFFLAMKKKDLASIKENIQDGFIFTSPRAHVLTKEKFINQFFLNPDLKFDLFQSSDEKLLIVGNAAVVNCLVEVKLADQTPFAERMTFSLVNQRNKWLIMAMHATFIS